MIEVTIPLRSHDEAIHVLGPYDRHAKLLRKELDIEIYTRGGNRRLKGVDSDVAEAKRRVELLLGKLRKGRELDPRLIEGILVGTVADGAQAQTRVGVVQGLEAADVVVAGQVPAARPSGVVAGVLE